MAVNLNWNHESYSCRLDLSEQGEPLFSLELRIPRPLTYGGCSLPSGWLSMTEAPCSSTSLSEQNLAELQSHLAEFVRLFKCPLLLTEDLHVGQLRLPWVTVQPKQFLQAPSQLFQQLSDQSQLPHSLPEALRPTDPRLPLAYGMPLAKQMRRLRREATVWSDLLPGASWLAWPTGSDLTGYALVQQQAEALVVMETWADNGDYSPLCRYLSQNGSPIQLDLGEMHPLWREAFRAGAMRCELWSGLHAWPSSMQQLLTAAQRELSARLRESRFFQFSGDVGIVVGDEKICLRVVRGGIIDVHHRDAAKPGWTLLEPNSFLQAFFGSKSITEAVLADASPTTLHLLEIIFTPRKH